MAALNSSASSELSLTTRYFNGLNTLLKSPSISREDLEQTFPQCVATAKQTAYLLADRLCWFAVAGTLIGARLGAVFLL